MKKIKIGQIGLGYNHGEEKMRAVLKFPELFEVVGYCEENKEWLQKRGQLSCYKDLPRMSEQELLKKCDAVLVECEVCDLTSTAKRCVDAGKHIHMDKPASGSLKEFENLLKSAINDVKSHYFCDSSKKDDVSDIQENCRYDKMMKDFYSYIVGEKQNSFTYEHDYIVQKCLMEIVGTK